MHIKFYIDLILWCLLWCFVVCQLELRHIFLAKFLHHTVRVVTNKLVGGAAGVARAKGKNNATERPLPQGRFLLAYSGDLTSTTDGTNAPDGNMCAGCKVLYTPLRAKMDWNDIKDYARTPNGTKNIKEVSDNRKGSTMDFPEQMTEEMHMVREHQASAHE